MNDRTKTIKNLDVNPQTGSISIPDALKLRNKLWEKEALLDQFIAENPAGLPPEDLALAASWHRKLAGTFYIFRHLKKYSVFISEEGPGRAYGVLGLYSPLEDITGDYLPVLVKAVLLPFEGQIIIDGLLEGYNLYFGSGIRADLKEVYRNAQEREGVITSLEPANFTLEAQRKEIAGRNAKLLKVFEKELAASNLSLKMALQHSENVAEFGREYLLAQEPPRSLLDLPLPDLQSYLGQPGHAASRVSLRRFGRFLANTGRLDPDLAAQLNDFLKSAGD